MNCLMAASLILMPVMAMSDSYLVLSPTCPLSPGCPAPAHIAFSLPTRYHFLTLPTQNTNTRTPPTRPPLSASRCGLSPGQCSVLSPSCPLVSPGCPVYSVYRAYTAPGSCQARCGHNPFSHPGQSCYCDHQCYNYGDCCQDYNQKCNSATYETTTTTSTTTSTATLTVRSGEERAYIDEMYTIV